MYEKEFLDRLAYFAVIDNGHSVRQEILIPVQLCVVVEVGCRINTDKQMKEAEKFKLSAKYYRDIVKKMLQKNYVTQTQYAELKSIIGSHNKTNEKDVVEFNGWPSGASIWRRYDASKREIINKIRPLIKSDFIEKLPTSDAMRQWYQELQVLLI